MKKLLFIITFSIFSTIIFAQELKDPTFRAPFTENSGNFMVITAFDKIGKSQITIDYVENLRKELDDTRRINSQQNKEISEAKKTITEQQKQLDTQKRELEEMKRSIDKLSREIEDLRRKVK